MRDRRFSFLFYLLQRRVQSLARSSAAFGGHSEGLYFSRSGTTRAGSTRYCTACRSLIQTRQDSREEELHSHEQPFAAAADTADGPHATNGEHTGGWWPPK